jgi:maltokinase
MALNHHELATLLAEWLPVQRWFGGKGRQISAVTVVQDVPIVTGDPALGVVIVRVDYGAGDSDHYQLLLGERSEQLERLAHATIGIAGDSLVYEAIHDTELTSTLLALIAEGGKADGLSFGSTGHELDTSLHSRVLGNEQSNTSLVYGDDYILKLFRRLAPGVNPDLEITRALDELGSPHIARPLGWYEGVLDDAPVTLGLMQEFLRFGTEGWSLATISVRDLYAEGDLHADEVGGDFAGEAERLGVATAEVHRDLATAFGTEDVAADRLRGLEQQMRERLRDACDVVPELTAHADAVAEVYAELPKLAGATQIQRIHGDYHLGQVMRTETGWVLIDFEGEPARPLAERRRRMSPLRDVAGMLRSFDYAARYLLAEQGAPAHLEYRASEWAERNREAFSDGYARASGADPREHGALLRAFELDKAVYEVVYEARNRPTWLPIPLGSIERLVGDRDD